ncbi:hypothetical protein KDN24_15035 [Bacillus sp. Bva_UNVM-123]|uniref:hypothetical protein n=1 Tax=Bacillus sp. Bva_UNVM-123 TaxID=2829798 RepID=UPI00391FA98A
MKTNKYNDFIRSLFEDPSSFYSATDLNEELCNRFNISNNYSRQLVRRATQNNIIKSSMPFSFSKGQYFYMHPSSSLNLATIKEISKQYRKPLFRLLSLLEINEGIVSMYEAIKITSTPISNFEKYKTVSLKEDLKRLVSYDFITIKTLATGERFILKSSEVAVCDELISKHQEKMREDTILIVDILRWFSNHGFISERPIYRSKDNPSQGAVFNDFLFDFHSFTKTTGFHFGDLNKEDSSSIVVADILLYRTYSDIDLQSFYERIQLIRNSTKPENGPRKVVPIIVYMDIEDETKKQLKKLHILNFSLESLLGFKVRRILNNIQSLRRLIQDNFHLSEIDSVKIIQTVQESLDTIEESGQNENLQNIKGDLFETLMFTIFTNLFPKDYVEHSVYIKNPDEPTKQPYEYDLVIKTRNEIIIVELKGFKISTIINLGSKDEKNTIQWFFGKTYPIAKKHFLKSSGLEKHQIKACYITSANFSDEAKEKLEEFNNTRVKPTNFDCFYDRKKLLKLLKKHDGLADIRETTGFIKTLEKYYLIEKR